MRGGTEAISGGLGFQRQLDGFAHSPLDESPSQFQPSGQGAKGGGRSSFSKELK
jgi:hypothetical protein